MKKIGLFIVSVFALSMGLAGCADEEAAAAFQTVEGVSVSEVAVVDGVKVQQKKSITSKEQFDEIVAPAISEDMDVLFPEEDDDDYVITPSDPTSNIIGRAAAEVTLEALSDAFRQIPEGFKSGLVADENTGKITLDYDWDGPTGALNFGDSPASGAISALNLKVHAKANANQEGWVKGSGSANAAAGGTVSVSGLTAIKNLKINAAAGANAGLNFNVHASALGPLFADEEEAEVKSDESLPEGTLLPPTSLPEGAVIPEGFGSGDEPEEKTPEIENPVKEFSGNLSLYAGADGALLFEAQDDKGDVYNGIIKATVTVSADTSVTMETIQSAVTAFMGGDEETDTVTAIDSLPFSISVVVDIYDVEGNKLFNYATAKSIAELQTAFAPEEKK